MRVCAKFMREYVKDCQILTMQIYVLFVTPQKYFFTLLSLLSLWYVHCRKLLIFVLCVTVHHYISVHITTHHYITTRHHININR